MNIVETLKFMLITPWHQSVLLQANHGLGKSSIVNYASKILSAGFMDIRLSQNDVGDIKGLPFMVGGRTHFAPPHWFPIHKDDEAALSELLKQAGMTYQSRPMEDKFLLFLDEMNRGTREVTQTAFQLILDYEMNGFKLPDYCKVMAAVNANGNLYHVLDWDPALLDRFAVIDFKPLNQEWFDWAKGEESKLPSGETVREWYNKHREALEAYDAEQLAHKKAKKAAMKAYQGGDRSKSVVELVETKEAIIHPAVMTFLMKREEALSASESVLSNNENRNKRLYSPRSWEMLSNTIFRAEAIDPNWITKEDSSFRSMVCRAYLGTAMGMQFDNYLTNDYVSLNADVILNKWDETVESHLRTKAKTIEKGGYNKLLVDFIKNDKVISKAKKLSDRQSSNLYKYLCTVEKEVVSDFWRNFNGTVNAVADHWYDAKDEHCDIILKSQASPQALKQQGIK